MSRQKCLKQSIPAEIVEPSGYVYKCSSREDIFALIAGEKDDGPNNFSNSTISEGPSPVYEMIQVAENSLLHTINTTIFPNNTRSLRNKGANLVHQSCIPEEAVLRGNAQMFTRTDANSLPPDDVLFPRSSPTSSIQGTSIISETCSASICQGEKNDHPQNLKSRAPRKIGAETRGLGDLQSTGSQRRKKQQPVGDDPSHNSKRDKRHRAPMKTDVVPLEDNLDNQPRKWSDDEDSRLKEIIAEIGEDSTISWTIVAEYVGTRDNVQCLQRWQKVLRPGLKKGQWSSEEDALLIDLESQMPHRYKNWGKLALHMPGRTSKQCRERWCHHLDPRVVKTEYSASEDELLLQLHHTYGRQWSLISKHLAGRTENNIRARLKALNNKNKKISQLSLLGATPGGQMKNTVTSKSNNDLSAPLAARQNGKYTLATKSNDKQHQIATTDTSEDTDSSAPTSRSHHDDEYKLNLKPSNTRSSTSSRNRPREHQHSKKRAKEDFIAQSYEYSGYITAKRPLVQGGRESSRKKKRATESTFNADYLSRFDSDASEHDPEGASEDEAYDHSLRDNSLNSLMTSYSQSSSAALDVVGSGLGPSRPRVPTSAVSAETVKKGIITKGCGQNSQQLPSKLTGGVFQSQSSEFNNSVTLNDFRPSNAYCPSYQHTTSSGMGMGIGIDDALLSVVSEAYEEDRYISTILHQCNDETYLSSDVCNIMMEASLASNRYRRQFVTY